MNRLIEVTKYNPSLRDHDGAYEGLEWTSFYDIGKTINGSTLDLHSYIKTEDQYVRVAEQFAMLTGKSSFQVRNVQIIDKLMIDEIDVFNRIFQEKIDHDYILLSPLVRIMLRGAIYCKIIFVDFAAIFVLEDMYMFMRDNRREGVPSNLIDFGALYVRDSSLRVNDGIFGIGDSSAVT